MRPALSATIVALAAVLVAACATPTGGRDGEPSAAPSEVWRSDGYGWTVAITGNRAQTYKTTSISCLPGGRALEQLGQPARDGAVRYGRRGVALPTLLRGTEGRTTLHLLGTAADVDLLPLPELLAACTRPMPDDPLTTFDVFWTTFAEHYNSFPARRSTGRRPAPGSARRSEGRPRDRPGRAVRRTPRHDHTARGAAGYQRALLAGPAGRRRRAPARGPGRHRDPELRGRRDQLRRPAR